MRDLAILLVRALMASGIITMGLPMASVLFVVFSSSSEILKNPWALLISPVAMVAVLLIGFCFARPLSFLFLRSYSDKSTFEINAKWIAKIGMLLLGLCFAVDGFAVLAGQLIRPDIADILNNPSDGVIAMESSRRR